MAMNVDLELDLLRKHAPLKLAFSGGKDSVVCKWLCQQAAVPFESFYSSTTIDPPELVRFIKQYHADVKWRIPKMPMMTAVATLGKSPPTRFARWCCERYKEAMPAAGTPIVIGVRAAESPRRARDWKTQVQPVKKGLLILPILRWSDEEVWACIRDNSIPYCKLYDEGFKRLGCIGCPLQSIANQRREFDRWPNFERNWKMAIMRNWEKWHAVPRIRDGMPRYQARYKSAEDFWQWWITRKRSPTTCGYEFPFPSEDPDEVPTLFDDEPQVVGVGPDGLER
jgi:phosphoadenosine phosphosulfate reductase